MDDTTREDYLALLGSVGLQTHGLGDLLRRCGSPAAVRAAADAQLAALPPATQQAVQAARDHADPLASVARIRARLKREHLVFLPLHDPRYPAPLRDIPDPPPWLFVRGNLDCLAAPMVAMVGSRRASHAGLRAATEIAEHLAAAGYVVCSGLALGIDAAAHRGALRGGRTLAVVASGIDRASPARHRGLLAEIERGGCVLSELPPGTGPSRWQFPRRNRIISGLASATLIVEAALPSGSLHTAASALEQGRDVFTLPWSIYHRQGEGCLQLLRDGATPITALGDLGDCFPGVQVTARQTGPRAADRQPAGAEAVLQLLGDGGLTLERLGESTGMDSRRLLVLLSELEIAGAVRRSDGTYMRTEHKSCQP